MFHRIAASLFATALLTSSALAQTSLRSLPAEGFKYLSAKEVDALTDKPGPGAKTAFPVDHENYYVEYAQRSDKGNEPEVHTHWTHYIQVLSGEATLVYGGTVSNAKETGPGQIRGDAIQGGTSRRACGRLPADTGGHAASVQRRRRRQIPLCGVQHTAVGAAFRPIMAGF